MSSLKSKLNLIKLSIYAKCSDYTDKIKFIKDASETLPGKVSVWTGGASVTAGLANSHTLSAGLLAVALTSGVLALRSQYKKLERREEKIQMGRSLKTMMFSLAVLGATYGAFANVGATQQAAEQVKNGEIVLQQNEIGKNTADFIKTLHAAENINNQIEQSFISNGKIDIRLEQKSTLLKETLQKQASEINSDLKEYQEKKIAFEQLGHKNLSVIKMTVVNSQGKKDISISEDEIKPIKELADMIGKKDFTLDNLKNEKIPSSVASLDG